MAYADYDYYVDDYLLGKDQVIPGDSFDYWEKRAERELDRYTFGRLSSDATLVTEDIQDCVCELAELFYQGDALAQAAYEGGGGGLLASFSNDGESGSYDLSQSDYTAEGMAKKVRAIIYRYLGYSGLLFAGARVKS